MHVAAVFAALLRERFHHCHQVVVHFRVDFKNAGKLDLFRCLLDFLGSLKRYVPELGVRVC
ncbi:Uncharacterised protein [uncultured archaeon]|nr:Uncharacterised protein [uncultured archaeon]